MEWNRKKKHQLQDKKVTNYYVHKITQNHTESSVYITYCRKDKSSIFLKIE